MKNTVNESQFRDAFRDIRPNNLSYAALGELYEWLEQYEEDTETEMELDVIAICCDFSEYTMEDLESDYGYLSDDDRTEWELSDWADFLQEHTFVIPVSYSNNIAPEMDTESLIIQAF